jgi:lysophospholipase L1-like esterase
VRGVSAGPARRLFAWLAAALLAFGVATVVGEAVTRGLARRHEAVLWSGERKLLYNPFRPDAKLGWALRPDWTAVDEGPDYRVTVRTNALGMRGGPASEAPAAGVVRVLVVGDSFAFGHGVEDEQGFVRRLETRWRSEGRPVEVLNAAVPGYGTDHHWIWLHESGFALRPDLVLLALCHNDVDDLGWSRLELDPDGLPVRVESRRRLVDENGRLRYVNEAGVPLPERWLPAGASAWLGAHSHLYNWLRFNAVRTWVGWAASREQAARARDAGPAPTAPLAGLPPAEIARGLRSGDAFRLRYHDHLVEAIAREATERGVVLRRVVTGREPGVLSDGCRADPRCFDASAVAPADAAPEAQLPLDGHWNAEGHRRVAEALHAWLGDEPALAGGPQPAGAPASNRATSAPSTSSSSSWPPAMR